MFLRLYHNINISKRTPECRLNYYGFRRRGFSNATINELKNVIESEIQGPASMRGYRGLWYSLKTNYGIIVQRDIVINILKEIDQEETNIRKARRLRRRKYVSEGPNSCWHYDGYDKLKTYGFPIHCCIDWCLGQLLQNEYGTENVLMVAIQSRLKASVHAHRCFSSVANIRIANCKLVVT